jgi:macrolide transport system ATP-binding/permease protein
MSNDFIKFHHISFSYDSSSMPLFHGLTIHLVHGWTGIVGANGAGKTTLLMLAVGLLAPEEGFVERPQHAIYCPQRTDHMPDQFGEMLADKKREAILIKARLGLQEDWLKRWETLSHGERKRVQIAVALWKNPIVLAVDEPTNHVDSEAREVILSALRRFNGIGMLVSHDRSLLDALCEQCVFMESSGVVLRPGGVTRGLQLAKNEDESLKREYLQRKRSLKALRQEAQRRIENDEKNRKKCSKRGAGKNDHDAKEKIDRARCSGKDAVGGKLLRQLQGRLNQAEERISSVNVKKEFRMGITIPGSRSQRNLLLQLPAGSLNLGDRKWLDYPEIIINPSDRIAFIGPNGSGKSTMIRHIVNKLLIPEIHITYLPQEITADHSQRILEQARQFPHEQLGYLMTVISRLGSRPERMLESRIPSPGEIRKLLLSIGILKDPKIIIMDEPTNHLDLPSIECLEQAIREVPCCLLLVSHDQRFLGSLAHTYWKFSQDKNSPDRFIMQIA